MKVKLDARVRQQAERLSMQVKGRKVSVQGTWSDERVALDLRYLPEHVMTVRSAPASAMETLRIESQPGLVATACRGRIFC